ncbi:MAG: hypothetical protein LBM18_00780 [Oscillospiraceae bacterium]|jgi:hypothetical protein|nr:hypothetical protein [Oscillospiraceae bacterium]
MKVSFEGIGEQVVTFASSVQAPAEKGCPVVMTGSAQVGAAGAGEKFVGIALASQGNYCAVQTAGFIKVGYSGQSPAVGFKTLAADGAGGVMADEGGREYLVAEVDEAGLTATILL